MVGAGIAAGAALLAASLTLGTAMRIQVLALGTRMPDWVNAGVAAYRQRLPRTWQLQLIELPLAKRGRKPVTEQVQADEGRRLLAAVPPASQLIALHEHGAQWSTAQLATALTDWSHDGRDRTLVIGGPDGLSPEVLTQAELHWSLSKLTLPHALVRIIVLEQLYRAWSLLNNHPYHRA